MHRHLNVINLTGRDDLAEFQQRLNMEAAARDMGPGSGMTRWVGPGQWVGDPEVIARARAAEATRAQMAAQAQANRDASAIKFPGPYRLYGSVA